MNWVIFDCAYYSLRSAVDTSTTIVFLADMPDMDREKYLEKWKNTEDFPMQGQMVKMLAQKGNIFRDMKVKMPRFFVEAKDLSAELNKYVHKQGLEHFYVSRNHPLNRNELQESFIEKFEAYFRKCTRIVAVMRLAIDPFPILLMDKEILYRCFDSMTDPYSSSFVEEYIGEKTIEEYKETEIYKGTYEAFIHDEKKSEATFNVTKHQYIDTKRINEIIEQFHLLNKWDQKAVLLINSCSKITKVYVGNSFFFYFTDRNTNRKKQSWSGYDFQEFAKSKIKTNQQYDEAYVSVFESDGETYFAEHNEQLNCEEIKEVIDAMNK